MEIKFSQSFCLRSVSRRDGSAKIYHQIILNKQERFFLPVNSARIPKGLFCTKKQAVAKQVNDYKEINKQLVLLQSKAYSIINKYSLDRRMLNKETFLNEYTGKNLTLSFNDFFKKELDLRWGVISNGTYKHHKAVCTKFSEFNKKVMIGELTPELIQDWHQYLVRKKLKGTTIWAQHKCVKTYINLAIRKGYIAKTPYADLKYKYPKTNPMFLEKDELNRLFEVWKMGKYSGTKKNVLQQFLFACFTGPRISDLKRLTHDNVSGGRLLYVQQKTLNTSVKEVVVPLMRNSMELICHKTHRLLPPFISEQKTRDYLKILMQENGINKKVGMHTARHTFGFICAQSGLSPQQIRVLMGHENIQTTMIYLHLSERYSKDQLLAVEDFLNAKSVTQIPSVAVLPS